MPRTKSKAQLDREIAQVLGGRGRHHATIAKAATHLAAIQAAIYRSKDPDDLIEAVNAAKKYDAAMKRVGSGHIDAHGEYDESLYELRNLLVKAKEMVRRLKIKRKTGRSPKPSRSTAWKLQ